MTNRSKEGNEKTRTNAAETEEKLQNYSDMLNKHCTIALLL